MQTVKEFLEAYVEQHGSASVLVIGDYVDIDVPGVKQLLDLPADVYVVSNTGIDLDIVESVDNVVYTQSGTIVNKSNHPPANAMGKMQHKRADLSSNVVAYTKNGLPCGTTTTPEPPQVPETTTPEPLNTTIPPQTPDEGVPFSITGGSDDVVEEVDDEGEEDDNNDVSGMVW